MNKLGMLILFVWLPLFATLVWLLGSVPWIDCLRYMTEDWKKYWRGM